MPYKHIDNCDIDFYYSVDKDSAVIRDVFIDELYKIARDFSNCTVLDLGANIGAFSCWFNKKYSGCKFYCVEPFLRNIMVLRHNLVLNNVQADVIEEGVNLTGNSFKLYMDNLYCNISSNWFLDKKCLGDFEAIKVSELPECDVLKIDIEGNELDVINNYPYLNNLKGLFVETHLCREATEAKILELQGMGFVLEKKMIIDYYINDNLLFCMSKGF